MGTELWDGLQGSDINPREPHVIGLSDCVVRGVPGMTYRATSTHKLSEVTEVVKT